MMISLLFALGIFFFLLPSCFLIVGSQKSDLFSRIHIEQKNQLRSAFQSGSKPGRGFTSRYLLINQERVTKIAPYVGLDQQKLALSLSRLHWNISLHELLLAKLLGGVCLVLSGSYVFAGIVQEGHAGYGRLLLLAVSVLLFLFPNQLVELADKQAKTEIKFQTPLFFSVVLALIEAGMPIHSAIRAAARRFAGRLGQELMLLETAEKSSGNWRIALEELAFRWDVDEFTTIVSYINQSLTKGTSVAGMLSMHIEEQIKQQEDEATEHMNRLSVRLIPLVIVFMGVPVLFLVMGPSFMGIKQHL